MNEEKKTELELRMYFFVPYNLSPIQQAIQAGHAALEYAYRHRESLYFRNFVTNWKTWIILDGGTTNSSLAGDGNPLGTLNQIHDELWKKNITHSLFYEPDLNDALTAVCFICDERVWDRENYPDFINYITDVENLSAERSIGLRVIPYEEVVKKYSVLYEGWVVMMGGNENIFLRDLIRDKRLA